MANPAYIALNEDGCWALYAGDGSETERTLLGVGQPFVPGQAIREAVAEIEAWAEANGYALVTPPYGTNVTEAPLDLDALFDEEG